MMPGELPLAANAKQLGLSCIVYFNGCIYWCISDNKYLIACRALVKEPCQPLQAPLLP